MSTCGLARAGIEEMGREEAAYWLGLDGLDKMYRLHKWLGIATLDAKTSDLFHPTAELEW